MAFRPFAVTRCTIPSGVRPTHGWQRRICLSRGLIAALMETLDADLIPRRGSFDHHHRKAVPDDYDWPKILAEMAAPGTAHPGHSFVSSS